MSDRVNHPPHYQGRGIEAIDVIEAFNLDFCLGNAVKYILRAGRKPISGISEEMRTAEIEDLEKALWYINRRIGDLSAPVFDGADGSHTASPEATKK